MGSLSIALMPYLSIFTNVSVADAKQSELLAVASRIVASQLGKPENYVMVSIAAGQRLAFAGSEEPAAFLELRSIRFPDAKRGSLCTELTDLIAEFCAIARDRIFLVMVDVDAKLWGHDGKTFG
jgi:phenylpyruvate tautomerase PptA (4-oxalocrotonate tautomerase family)